IAWREAPRAKKRARRGATAPAASARVAHLHDEEARIEERSDGSRVVEAGPVGALVLLLEADLRGLPTRLIARAAGEVPGFDQGAIEARWDPPTEPAEPGPTLRDLVGLARYALV
ncbi:MAG TPA: hypothetical protein VIZ68_00975, partial [Thermoplasmata archaeon]